MKSTLDSRASFLPSNTCVGAGADVVTGGAVVVGVYFLTGFNIAGSDVVTGGAFVDGVSVLTGSTVAGATTSSILSSTISSSDRSSSRSSSSSCFFRSDVDGSGGGVAICSGDLLQGNLSHGATSTVALATALATCTFGVDFANGVSLFTIGVDVVFGFGVFCLSPVVGFFVTVVAAVDALLGV